MKQTLEGNRSKKRELAAGEKSGDITPVGRVQTPNQPQVFSTSNLPTIFFPCLPHHGIVPEILIDNIL